MESNVKPFETGCRYCGRTDAKLRRGLCGTHFTRFNRKFNKLAEESAKKAEEFEQKCIDQGWVSARAVGGRQKEDDPFDQIAAEVEAEFARDLGAAVARDKAAQSKQPAKKRSPRKKAE
ncbi:MAG TPA: hypothetical protein DDZ51_18580 [Planctomycetaceae bacterium]|nr:hypothetical protein [Planctomycetaceae bacterium]